MTHPTCASRPLHLRRCLSLGEEFDGQGRAVHLAGALFSQRLLRSLCVPPIGFLKSSLISSTIWRRIWSIVNMTGQKEHCFGASDGGSAP